MLSGVAKETKTWLVGGRFSSLNSEIIIRYSQDPSRSKTLKAALFITPVLSTIPMVRTLLAVFLSCIYLTGTGDLIAMHRKVHLFDIDIPGKIKFKVSW
jgi:predicted amidohydrolase